MSQVSQLSKNNNIKDNKLFLSLFYQFLNKTRGPEIGKAPEE